jgi:polar amino acid transport system substrate-binding protein
MHRHFTFAKAQTLSILLIATILTGCDAPADPEGSTRRILATHELLAGASDNPPWIWFEGDLARGPEAELVQDFAASMGAHVRWRRGAESPLIALLAARKLDVAAGGFMSDTIWGSEVGTSGTYAGSGLFRSSHVLLTATGENQLLLRLDRFLAHRKSQRHDGS